MDDYRNSQTFNYREWLLTLVGRFQTWDFEAVRRVVAATGFPHQNLHPNRWRSTFDAPSVRSASAYSPVARISAITILPPGLRTLNPSRIARFRSAFDRMLWIARLDTTRSKVASGNGSARISAVSMCTRSLTPSNDALHRAASLALPDWSVVLQISTPVTRPVVSLRAIAVSTAPRPQPISSTNLFAT